MNDKVMNSELPKIRKPTGWKVQGSFWVKSSKYGLRYMCPVCGRKALGTNFRDNRHHHTSKCPRFKDN